MLKYIVSSLLFFLLVVNSATAQLKLVIEGLSGELKNNVDLRISLMDIDNIDNTPYFKRSLEKEIKIALQALGYYNPEFAYHFNEEGNKLTVEVAPGVPVLIAGINVDINGQGENDPAFVNLLKTEPTLGSVLNHGVYDAFVKQLQSIALRKGYFDSELLQHQLAVAVSLREAFWRIKFDTGPRYKFGDVTIKETVIRESYLRNVIPFKTGDYYLSDDLSLLNRRLSSTNWFSSVTVIPLFNKMTADNELPIHVIALPRKENVVDVGIGYSNDNGMRGKLNWHKPWINNRGHSFQSSLLLSGPEQTITGLYKIPLFASPLEDYYTLQGGYKKIDNNDTYSHSYTFGVIRNHDSFEGWQRSMGLNMLFDNFTQADDNYKTFLLYPSFSFSRIRADGRLFPLWGDSQRYTLEAAAKNIGSDIDFIRLQMQHVWIRTLEEKHRFIARGSFGFIQANDFNRVPPSFRFFAGGDRSIRGFKYQSISPKDKNGKLMGSSRLVTGSIEYQYNVSGDWWSALFVDTGEAIDRFDKTDFRTGVGVGVRWASPIGPLKVDIATPVSNFGNSVQFYIGLGAEL